jgi:hypothetical protein
LEELDHYLRDHPTGGDVRHFDPWLFDLLYDLTASLGDSSGEIDVICGYRTPWSNEFLRTRSLHTGVARHSLHMLAEAIDIRLPGIPTSSLGMRPCACIVEESVTIVVLTSCTSTSGVYASGEGHSLLTLFLVRRLPGDLQFDAVETSPLYSLTRISQFSKSVMA